MTDSHDDTLLSLVYYEETAMMMALILNRRTDNLRGEEIGQNHLQIDAISELISGINILHKILLSPLSRLNNMSVCSILKFIPSFMKYTVVASNGSEH